MTKLIRANLILFLATLLLSSVLYPAALLAVAQGLFPTKANGSLVPGADGKPVGSSQIAQAFAKDEYFQPRPSAAGYNAAATSGSNWGAAQPKLRFRVARQIGPVARYADGRPVGPDVEAWFAQSDRLAAWAAANTVAASEWVKTGDDTKKIVAEWSKANPDVVERWANDNPKADEPADPEAAPDAVAVQFFASFAAKHPRMFPSLADGKPVPVAAGSDLQGVMFDAWLQEHPQAKLEQVPADAVTASGAGMDPHITLRNAKWQLGRVAGKRSPSAAEAARVKQQIEELVREQSSSPLGGLAGEAIVNVLTLNLELDKRFPVAVAPATAP